MNDEKIRRVLRAWGCPANTSQDSGLWLRAHLAVEALDSPERAADDDGVALRSVVDALTYARETMQEVVPQHGRSVTRRMVVRCAAGARQIDQAFTSLRALLGQS